jgi:hypothetical protein
MDYKKFIKNAYGIKISHKHFGVTTNGIIPCHNAQ